MGGRAQLCCDSRRRQYTRRPQLSTKMQKLSLQYQTAVPAISSAPASQQSPGTPPIALINISNLSGPAQAGATASTADLSMMHGQPARRVRRCTSPPASSRMRSMLRHDTASGLDGSGTTDKGSDAARAVESPAPACTRDHSDDGWSLVVGERRACRCRLRRGCDDAATDPWCPGMARGP